jgi:hypothetical protein
VYHRITVAPESVAAMRRDGLVYVQLRDTAARTHLLAVSRDEDDPLVNAFIASIRPGTREPDARQ